VTSHTATISLPLSNPPPPSLSFSPSLSFFRSLSLSSQLHTSLLQANCVYTRIATPSLAMVYKQRMCKHGNTKPCYTNMQTSTVGIANCRAAPALPSCGLARARLCARQTGAPTTDAVQCPGDRSGGTRRWHGKEVWGWGWGSGFGLFADKK